ncbi:MAG: TonB C-terminal domain-containing protein [Sandaracinaceae bacterium]|nr:TonB C-terminal domain-containing protein [Sandaracinaceae bacterium]
MNRALYYDPADGRPDSGLTPFEWVSVGSVLGGLALTVTIPAVTGLLFLVVVVVEVTRAAIGDDAPDERARILEEEDIIEARFVQLGRDFEHELPNRQVPLLSTAPPEPALVPTEATPTARAEPRERPRERPPDPVEDLIARIGDRAHVFAEIAERREREGSPDGLEEGTERTATPGDVYRGRLYSFFRRGWTIPTTLNRNEANALTAAVDIEIGQDLEIVSFRLRSGSGNALFDQSVTEQLARLQSGDQRIPPPPDEVASQYIGQTIAVRFHGRQAR